MGELITGNYLNPLTLEAQMFLNSLKTYGQSCKQIDANLLNTLEEVVDSIDMLLNQQLAPIVATENTIPVECDEICKIYRTFHCSACKVDLGKAADKVVFHLATGHKTKKGNGNKAEMRQRKTKKLKELSKVPKKAAALLRSDLNGFFSQNISIAEELEDIPAYNAIEEEVLDLISPRFPAQSVKIYKFGSRIGGIASKTSDLDIYVDIGKTFHNFENRASDETKSKLASVFDAMKEKPNAWCAPVAVWARVPILKVRNQSTGIKCDIGFSNSLGYCNTQLIRYIFELQPIARYMCIFLKKCMQRFKIGDDLTTYSISLMVIFFLQINKHLPSIESLQLDMETNMNIGPWIANFMKLELKDFAMETMEVQSANCRIFLKNFFEFYSQFNFTFYAICPYLGKIIKIGDMIKTMPVRYKTYVATCADSDKAYLEINKPMVVQDPIELNHNVTKAVYPNQLKTMIAYFRESAEILSKIII